MMKLRTFLDIGIKNYAQDLIIKLLAAGELMVFFFFQRERFEEALEKLQTAYDENALPLVEATSLVQAMVNFILLKVKSQRLKRFKFY